MSILKIIKTLVQRTLVLVITVLMDAEANPAARTLLGGILQENEALKDSAIYWRLYLIN